MNKETVMKKPLTWVPWQRSKMLQIIYNYEESGRMIIMISLTRE